MLKDDIIGQQAVGQQIQGLQALQSAMGPSFAKIVAACFQVQGKVVLTGVGKSGYIAQKISATLSSLGTAAIFLHPTEAAHGDLGVTQPLDGIILFSNSGETKELSAVLRYAKQLNLPTISITSHANSALAQNSDLTFILPKAAEASELGAPTTSTTMMLVLGDALAIALQRRRNFSVLDYKKLHPGGNIGNQLLTVAEVISQQRLPRCQAQDTLLKVIEVMLASSYPSVGVLDRYGNIVGAINKADIVHHIPSMQQTTAEEIMGTDQPVISSSCLLSEVQYLFAKHPETQLLVADNHQIIGILWQQGGAKL